MLGAYIFEVAYLISATDHLILVSKKSFWTDNCKICLMAGSFRQAAEELVKTSTCCQRVDNTKQNFFLAD